MSRLDHNAAVKGFAAALLMLTRSVGMTKVRIRVPQFESGWPSYIHDLPESIARGKTAFLLFSSLRQDRRGPVGAA